MFAHEIWKILTVAEWAKFRHWVKPHPVYTIANREGTMYVDYDERDVYEFLNVERAGAYEKS